MKTFLLTTLLILTAVTGLSAQTAKYSITDLGPSNTSWQINDNAVAAGTISMTGSMSHAAKWDPASGVADLTAGMSGNSVAKAVNFFGDVAGWSADSTGADHAAVWQANKGMALLPLPGTAGHARAINDSGQIVGDYQTTRGSRSFLLDPVTGVTELPILPNSTDCYATAINKYQDIVGYCFNPKDLFPLKAFIWDRQSGTRLLFPKFSGTSVAFGINALRQIVGYVQDKTSYSAFTTDMVTKRTQYFSLASVGRTTVYAIAHGINEAGQVAGESNAKAVLYDKGKLFDLNTLVADGSGWVLTAAYQVNASGQIVGVGNLNGNGRAFLLSPIR